MDFDVAAIDEALEKLCPEPFTPLREFQLFSHLPTLEMPWNIHLLTGYIQHFSRAFNAFTSSFTGDMPCGAIVRQDSGLNSLDDVLALALARDESWQDAESAGTLLTQMGLASRRPGNLKALMRRAGEIRQEED